jgi:hypothetical protein
MRRSRSLHRAAGIVTILVLAGACGDADEQPVTSVTTAGATSSTGVVATSSTTAATAPSTAAAPTVTEPTPPPTAAASTTIATTSELVLRGDGLGVVSFSDDADETIAVLTEILGPSDADTGWMFPFNQFGTCYGDLFRAVLWTSLRVELHDGALSLDGTGELTGPQFRAYSDSLFHPHFEPVLGLEDPTTPDEPADPPSFITTRPLGLRTADGVGLESTVAELRTNSEGTTTIVDSPYGGPLAQMPTPDGPLTAYLTGTDDTDTVRTITAGFACGE